MKKSNIEYKKENFWKDFFKLYFPILIAFLVSFFINLIDLYFAAKISPAAIAAIQLIFPLFFILIALNEGFNIATNNLLSKALWENNKEKFNKVFILAVFFAWFIWIFFFLFSSYLTSTFLWFFKLTPQVYDLAFSYIDTIFKWSFFYFFLGIIFATLVVLQEKNWQIVVGIISLIVNAFLDYYFVVVLGYETYWLALASIIMLAMIFIYFLVYYLLIKKILKFSKKDFIWVFSYFRLYLSYFLWAFFSLIIFIIEFIATNYFVSQFWTNAMAAFWLSWKLFDFFMYPFFALILVFTTMYGYHLWKKDILMQKFLIKRFLKLGFIYGLFVVLFVLLVFKNFLYFFVSDSVIISYAKELLFILSAFFIAFIPNYLFSQWLQVVGYHKIRVFANAFMVLCIVLFEWLSFKFYHSFIWVFVWWLLAQLIFSIFIVVIFLFLTKKEIF
jgi:putative MATE family efflux protein